MEFCAFKTFDQVPKITCKFWQLIEFFDQLKSQKIQSTDYENFDQLKKDNFDQMNCGQTTPCQNIN